MELRFVLSILKTTSVCLVLSLLLRPGGVVMCQPVDSDGEVAPMDEAERDSLFSTIQCFVGDGWNGSDLYPDPCGWTPIQGVSCDLYDGLWYVTALNIGPVHDNSLVCSTNPVFAPQLFGLAHLKSFSLFDCFTQPNPNRVLIPSDGWERLAGTIESLEFRANRELVGRIPSSFGQLTKLDSLVLLDNGLNGELPSGLANLRRLRRLVLSQNSFTGPIPSDYGGLTELLILDLSGNSLSGTLPPSLGGLNSLLKLDLSNNRLLSGNLPGQLGDLKNLTLLDLRNNNFTGGLNWPAFEGMESLEGMLLSDNPVGGGLESVPWEKLGRLEILDLDNTGLTGGIPKSISEMKRLRYLGLGDNNLTGNPPWEEISSLPCINAIYVNGNDLAGELKFSGWFYRKLGRRFGAWNNPKLCYPVELMSTGMEPHGVKQCQRRGALAGDVEDGDSKDRLGDDGDWGRDSSTSGASSGPSWRWGDAIRLPFVVGAVMAASFLGMR